MANIFSGRFYPNGLQHQKVVSKDTLWLQIIPRSLVVGNTLSRMDNVSADTSKSNGDTMWFLMPDDINFSVTHTWEDLSSPASATREISAKVQNQLNIAGGLAGKSYSTGEKADNPYLYANTNRREIPVLFQFSVFNDTFSDVYAPIQSLIEQSCPDIMGGLSEFRYPSVFSLQTYTGDMKSVDIISVKTVGITTILPAYKGPWVGGYPSSASVDVTFVDLNPLYKSTLINERSKKISTASRSKTVGQK